VIPALSRADPAAAIWALTSGYSSEIRAQKPLVMLQAYIDDSASDHGDQRLFLAGYINTADRWIRFSDAWAEELRQTPSIGYLKMSEANGFGGEFRGWDKTDRDEKIKGLARVIRHFEPRSIHASVSRSEFMATVAPVAPHGFGTPYSLCFQAMMLPLAIRQSKERFKVSIDFIFDNQEGLGTQAAFFYGKIRETQPKHIREVMCASPIFRDEKDVLPLQAADMLAWHIRRRHETDPMLFQVPDFLSHDGLHIAVDIQNEQLRHIAEGFSKVLGVPKLKAKSAWKRTFREIERLESEGIDTSKMKRPGTYYPKNAPLLLRMIAPIKRWLSNPRWPPRDKSP
jgi:hypothetical protein